MLHSHPEACTKPTPFRLKRARLWCPEAVEAFSERPTDCELLPHLVRSASQVPVQAVPRILQTVFLMKRPHSVPVIRPAITCSTRGTPRWLSASSNGREVAEEGQHGSLLGGSWDLVSEVITTIIGDISKKSTVT